MGIKTMHSSCKTITSGDKSVHFKYLRFWYNNQNSKLHPKVCFSIVFYITVTNFKYVHLCNQKHVVIKTYKREQRRK